tara:strand:- start:328 stop:915 length:588 start_codon:yes stop_codon:yes gene_type:complete
MIKSNVIILSFNSLYEILDEFKENLSFKIIQYKNDNDFINDSDFDIINSLIILRFNHKLLLDKYVSEKNILKFNDSPLPLPELLEMINIKLIKLKFNHQSKINISGYELNLNSKIFSKNDLNIKLTEKEIQIILYLNETKTKHNILDLQKNIWEYAPDMETHTVETHIYRLRKKISDKFKDDNFILSHQNGYFIN